MDCFEQDDGQTGARRRETIFRLLVAGLGERYVDSRHTGYGASDIF